MPVEIRGLDQLIKKLGKAQGTAVMVKPMQRSVLRLQKRMQEYPPALSVSQGPVQGPLGPRASRSRRSVRNFRQGYRRTGTYGRRWTTKVAAGGSGVTGRVGNNTRYAPYVGSHQFQARVHQGRWNTDEKIVRQEAPGILADFQREVDRALAE